MTRPATPAVVLFVPLLALALAGPPAARANGPAPAATPQPSASRPVLLSGEFDEAAAARRAPVPRSARMAEVEAVIAAQDVQLADLRRQLESTTDPLRRVALQRQVGVVKAQARLDVTLLQLDHARRANAPAGVAALGRTVERLQRRVEAARTLAATPVSTGVAAGRRGTP